MRRIINCVGTGMLMLVLFLTPAYAFAQNTGLDAAITLPSNTTTREQVITEIEKQTPFKVAYARRLFDDKASVAISGRDNTLRSVLDKMLADTEYSYHIDGRYIVIYNDQASESATVVIATLRNVFGQIVDVDSGDVLSDVNVELVDDGNIRTTTNVLGRFILSGVPAGNRVLKLFSADGSQVRYREINVPTGSDVEVSLSFGGDLLQSAALWNTENLAPQPVKSTAYFIQNSTDHTIRAFSDEAKTEFTFIPSARVNNDYLPKFALKTNLLYLATTTLNVGAEFGLARKWTLDVTAGLNTWDLNSRKGGIRHWLVQPELRYWFCQRFEKHFIGLHGIGGQYQIQDIDLAPLGNDLTGRRYDGYGIGGGVSYGYHLPMSKRWSWEFTVGVGYIYLNYDKYSCGECDNLVGNKSKHYFGPTKVGVSLIFMIQ